MQLKIKIKNNPGNTIFFGFFHKHTGIVIDIDLNKKI